MTDQPNYPYPDGDVTVLGPEIFASKDGAVISWKGANYVRHPASDAPAPPLEAASAAQAPVQGSALREQIAAAIWERQNPGRRWADCDYRWRADAEADADAVLAVILQHGRFLGDQLRDAEAALTRIRQGLADVIADMSGITGARHWIAALDRLLNPPAHDGGPTVREAAADDAAHWNAKYDRP